MNFLKLTMIDTPSPRDADASKNGQTIFYLICLTHIIEMQLDNQSIVQ